MEGTGDPGADVHAGKMEAADAADAADNESLIGKVSEQLVDGEVAVISLVQETQDRVVEDVVNRYTNVNLIRQDAAEVAAEVEHAIEVQKELEKEGYLLQYFSCSKKQYQEEWETLYHAFPVAETGGVVYFVTINHTNEAFSLPADEIRLNKHNAAQLQADAEALKGLLAAKQAQLEAWALLHLATLEDKLEHTRQALDWTKVNLQTTALVNNKLCLLEGFQRTLSTSHCLTLRE